jgi:hypothetical protein
MSTPTQENKPATPTPAARTASDYSRFIVTGKDVRGKRFRMTYGSEAARFAFAINLYNGSVFGVRVSDGKRELLKRVQN